MGLFVALCIAVVFLAYANGANDNFKGVATLYGSRTLNYRQALTWATLATCAGSLCAVALAGGLVAAFSGKGLVPNALTQDPAFLLAVALAAALTVMGTALVGLPISTTHALAGALVGAGLVAAGSVNLAQLGQRFFLPLAVSPFMSLAITSVLYPVFRRTRQALGVERQMCVCVGGGLPQPAPALVPGGPGPVALQPDGTAVVRSTGLVLSVGQLSACEERYHGRVFGIDAQQVLDRLHVLSAGAVSFARGLNDTPKIVALLVAAKALRLPMTPALLLVAGAMALGGWLGARRIAATMAERITSMNHGQAFTANLTTSLLVLFASRWGLPVSTTHVSCGSLFGLGAVTGQARWGIIRAIVAAWIGTLPVAAALAAATYMVMR